MSDDTRKNCPMDLRIREAARWLVTLQQPNVSPQLLLRWEKWQASAENRDAFDSIERQWRAVQSSLARDRGSPALATTHGAPHSIHRLSDARTARETRIKVRTETKPRYVGGNAQLAVLNDPVFNVFNVSEEAAYWHIRCNDDGDAMRISDRRQYLAWLRRSAKNVSELLKLAKLDVKLRSAALVTPGLGSNDENVIGTGESDTLHVLHRGLTKLYDDEFDTASRRIGTSAPSRAFAIAASILVAICVTLLFGSVTRDGAAQTGANHWQHLKLEDGSILHADARTRLKVEFTSTERLVYIDEGSAVFEVAKDLKRPFIARTPLIDAIAVGTRFGVDLKTGVKTTVSEGVVKVIPRGKPNGQSVTVRAGEELLVSADGLAEPSVRKVDAEHELAWAKGWYVIRGDQAITIGEAVREFNRRNSTQIQIEQPDIATRTLSGYIRLRADQSRALAKVIAARNELEVVVDLSRNAILLRAQQPREQYGWSATEKQSEHPSQTPHYAGDCRRPACD